jgi:integrase
MRAYFNKKRNRWMYDLQINGKRYNRYCIDPDTGAEPNNQTEADKIVVKIKARLLTAVDKKSTAVVESEPLTVLEAFVDYANRMKGQRNWSNNQTYVRELVNYFGAQTHVISIDEKKIWDYILWARQQPVMVYVGGNKNRTDAAEHHAAGSLFRPAEDGRTREDSTINRYLQALNGALGAAYKLRCLDGSPRLNATKPDVPNLKEPEALPRPISDANIQRMIETGPPHLADAVLLNRLMGFRKAEAFDLTKGQVDFPNRGVWLEARDTKGKRGEFVHASEAALQLLKRLVDQANERGTEYLITYPFKKAADKVPGKRIRRYLGSEVIDGKRHLKRETVNLIVEWRPIKNPKRSWKTLNKKLGLDHKFHQTKASFVTAVAHVAPAAVVQQAGRQKDYRTTQRYIKVADQAMKTAVEEASFKPQPTSEPVQNSDLTPEERSSPEQESRTEN